jgi:glutathione peroxidase
MNIYDINVENIKGQTLSMNHYKGKVLLIVNVASKCGFTSQYKELQALYEQYKTKDFMVLGFPCNQFKEQEPLSNKKIEEFCQLNFGVSFDMFAKIDVNAQNAHPLYKFLKNEKGGFLNDEIKWNFTKFLVDKHGNVIKRYAPYTNPSKIAQDIEKLF